MIKNEPPPPHRNVPCFYFCFVHTVRGNCQEFCICSRVGKIRSSNLEKKKLGLYKNVRNFDCSMLINELTNTYGDVCRTSRNFKNFPLLCRQTWQCNVKHYPNVISVRDIVIPFICQCKTLSKCNKCSRYCFPLHLLFYLQVSVDKYAILNCWAKFS